VCVPPLSLFPSGSLTLISSLFFFFGDEPTTEPTYFTILEWDTRIFMSFLTNLFVFVVFSPRKFRTVGRWVLFDGLTGTCTGRHLRWLITSTGWLLGNIHLYTIIYYRRAEQVSGARCNLWCGQCFIERQILVQKSFRCWFTDSNEVLCVQPARQQ
jgi:hypothetical protein